MVYLDLLKLVEKRKKIFPKWWWKMVIYHGKKVNNHLKQIQMIGRKWGISLPIKFHGMQVFLPTCFGGSRYGYGFPTPQKKTNTDLPRIVAAAAQRWGFGAPPSSWKNGRLETSPEAMWSNDTRRFGSVCVFLRGKKMMRSETRF